MLYKKEYVDAVRKHSGNPEQFFKALEAMAAKLGINPYWIADAIWLESMYKPSAVNPSGGATGLIQFVPSTAKALGTTTDQIRVMTNIQQIPFIEKYLRGQIASVKANPQSWFDVYCLIFYPPWVKSPNAVIAQPTLAYKYNAAIDLNKDGKITKSELREKVQKRLPGGEPSDVGAGKWVCLH